MKTTNISQHPPGQAVIRTIGSSKPKRRNTQDRYLAAVMFIDVENFTRVMHQDEPAAIDKLHTTRAIIEKHHLMNQGRIIQYYGDGCLSTFASVSDAIQCALQIQREALSRSVLPLRVGIHAGEVIECEGAIYGEVVNTTARLEGAASAGSVLISDEVFRIGAMQDGLDFIDLGYMTFKNIDDPMHVYAIDHRGIVVPAAKKSNSLGLKKLARQLQRHSVFFSGFNNFSGICLSIVLIFIRHFIHN